MLLPQQLLLQPPPPLTSAPPTPPPPSPTPCYHARQHGCLRTWLRATPLGATCPACRSAIPRAPPAVNVELRRALERVARASPPPPLPLIPEAELVEGALLGHGGFGTVHAATWHALPVALKSLRLEAGDATDAARRAFEREMQVLYHLRHPNIVPVFGVCHHGDSRVSLVEALAERGDLHALLHPPGGGSAPLPAATALRLGLDIARGLAHAHSKGVAHMDVKPANVLRGEGDRLMLTDFGLAQRVRSSLPHTHGHSMLQSSAGGGGGGSGGHGWAGTVCYTAPEALSGSEGSADYRQPPCDVFSLGVVLWELCSGGQLPWRDKNLLQVIRAVDRGERPALPAGVHAGLGALIARCWAQAPGERPSASDVVVQLAALLAGLAPPAQGGGGGGGGGGP